MNEDAFAEIRADMRALDSHPSANQREDCESVTTAVEWFSNIANRMGYPTHFIVSSIVYAFIHQHRTLQQGMIRMMSAVIAKIGEVDSHDLRNEAAIAWCREVGKIPRSFPVI